MRIVAASLLCTLFASAAFAQSAPAPADELQAARAKTCAAFLNEMTMHTAAGNPGGTTPSFAVVWAALLKADQDRGAGMGKMGLGSLMFDNTVQSCQRMRGRTLGATMDAEFAAL